MHFGAPMPGAQPRRECVQIDARVGEIGSGRCMVPSFAVRLVPGSLIGGKLRLQRLLAAGGMGSVWVAQNEQLDIPVAVKFMAPSMVASAELVTRFEREAKAAAQLRHPNVVQIYEHGVHEGIPFMAMELLEGESLSSRLKGKARLTLAETSRILGDVCLALRRAHEKGFIHRDLKPANIFLCSLDELEVVKVLDFGIAKSLAPSQEEVTQTGAVLGSPHYMSPEQARRGGRPVDHRTDLWSLGIIAFRCLAGRLPFAGDDAIGVLVRVCTEDAPRASDIAPDLGPDVDAFLERALARDPGARFQSAREFADALGVLAGRPGRASMASIADIWTGVDAAGPAPVSAADTTTTVPLPRPGAPGATAASPTMYSVYSSSVPAHPHAPPTFGAGPSSAPFAGPSSAPGEPVQSGTLTSAGTEVMSRGSRPEAWVIPAAALAVVVVVGVVASAVFLARDSKGVVPSQGPAAPVSSAVTDPTVSIEPVQIELPEPSDTEPGTSAPSASAAAPGPFASATAGTAAKPPSPSGKPATTAAPGKSADSGFLRPAQF
jgi:serine/threonine protein kinase